MRKIILLGLLFFCGNAFAQCTAIISPAAYVNLGNIIVQRDAPVGSVITSKGLGGSSYAFNCGAGSDYAYLNLVYNGGKISSMENVYLTNLPGVGVAVQSNWGPYFANPGTRRGPYANGPVLGTDPTVIFYKIAPIVSGPLLVGQLATLSDSAGRLANNWNISGGTITQVACSINTPSLTFPIGDILASSFGTSVGTTPSTAQNTQNLGLDCDAGANINVSLQGTQNPDVSTTSVLALTNQGDADVAKGVGVQLIYNGSPLVLNNRIVLKQSAGGQETFPITARYYQTKTAVTTGKANASATLNLTYQ